MRHWRIILVRLIGLLIAFPILGAATEFTITESVIAGGGGSSTGNEFSVQGTIGQPAAGIAISGSFELEAGFWNRAAAPEAPDEPTLQYAASQDGMTLFWESEPVGYVLEFTPSLNPPTIWSATSEVPVERNGFWTVNVPTDRAMAFYRLRYSL
jgi:hypothetical protein